MAGSGSDVDGSRPSPGGDGGDEGANPPRDGPGLADDSPVCRAWRRWLSALATDADAAVAAALVYESLPPGGRDAWLDVLDADAPRLAVPPVALYAPLLAVESDGVRRERIGLAIGAARSEGVPRRCETRALLGAAPNGMRACVVVTPLYLDFVQLLACRYTLEGGFVDVRHEPLLHVDDLRSVGDVDGIPVEPTTLRVLVDELAHAILAGNRQRRAAPPALASFVHLFAAHVDDGER